MRFILTSILSLALAFDAGSVLTQDYQKGLVAYGLEDYDAAMREWRPLAEQGHADSQEWIGFLYFYGEGVPQNYAEAAKWYRLAAEQGWRRLRVFSV